ncbi:MAG TPA: TIGR03087 family PEP-CTERM/XrtA system glycosyltransferase [Gammaproteobacteria bacterium]|nr:TIGR03087 family PEP-CTERM/XrtA system glycosyltransferase [Gammaproteobacteria bacterium]
MEHLLFLCHRIPYPPDKGDKIRSYNWLQGLSGRYRIHLGTFLDEDRDEQYTGLVRSLCEDALFLRLRGYQRVAKAPGALVRHEALTLASYRNTALRQWVDALANRVSFRAVLAFSSGMAPYALVPSLRGVRRIMDFVDADSEKWRQYAVHSRPELRWLYRREARRMLAAEGRFARAFDANVFVSDSEARLFLSRVPDAPKVEVVGNGVDCDYFDPRRDYRDPYDGAPALVFTGAMDYAANADAVRWFAHEVFPRIRARIGRARFTVVGHRPTQAVRRLERLPGVAVTGRVEDVRPWLAHARAVVAPLRIARGVQNKVLEGLAMDRPLLATPQAIDGIGAYPAGLDTVSDDPEVLAAAAIGHLDGTTEPQQGVRRRFVQRNHGWAASVERLACLLEGGTASGGALARHLVTGDPA